jgi:hypothetical protein
LCRASRAVEMTHGGKRGKPKPGFPPLSTALGNPAESAGFPHSHSAHAGDQLPRHNFQNTPQELGADYAAGEFRLRLWHWERERRFVVIRERVCEEKRSLGRKLLEVPGYTFRVFVTSCEDRPEGVWRDYNRRADVEKRIAELKYDLAADDFCLHEFFPTEAAFCAILMLFNLLAEFQRATGISGYRQPATLRLQVFLCGAILGRAGHRTVLHLSSAWGGLEHRNALFDSLLTYFSSTSPKLNLEPLT